MECIKNPEKNCCSGGICRDDVCPDTHSCCSQQSKNGNNSTLGICVKKDENGGGGNCDKKRGLPVKSCKDNTNTYTLKNSSESFKIFSKEGYTHDDNDDKNCNRWENAFNILFLIIILLLITCCVLYVKCKKSA